jgi:hypothetical protein
MFSRGLLAVLAIGLLIQPTQGDPVITDGSVGAIGGAQRIDLILGPTFPEKQVRGALDRDIELELSAAPSSRIDDYLAAVKKRLTDGYRRAGFPRPHVTVDLDRAAGRVKASVQEGRRYFRGDVRVEGKFAQLKPEHLIAQLTTAHPRNRWKLKLDVDAGSVQFDLDPEFYIPEVETDWEAGKPVSFLSSDTVLLSGDIRSALAELGFFRARFRFDQPIEAGTDRVPLVIEIVDEGPLARVDSVQAVGAVANQPAEVVELFGLKPGDAADLPALRNGLDRLWDSGRFQIQKLRASVDAERGRAMVALEVKEMKNAPPLRQPLTDIQQAALRLGRWIDTIESRDDELLLDARVRFSGFAIDWVLAIAPRAGMASRVRTHLTAETPATNPATAPATRPTGIAAIPEKQLCIADFAAAADAKSVFWIMPQEKAWSQTTSTSLVTAFNLSGMTSPDPAAERTTAFNLGLGFRTPQSTDSPESLIEMRIAISPAFALELVTDAGRNAKIQDGVLQVSFDKVILRADAATGRLIDVVGSAAEADIRLTIGPGQLQRTREAVLATVPKDRQADPSMLVALARMGLLRGLAYQEQDAARYGRAVEAWNRLFTPDVTEPMLAFIEEALGAPAIRGQAPKDTFTLPLDPQRGLPQQFTALTSFTYFLMPAGNMFFPRGSWPWLIAREWSLSAGGWATDSPANARWYLRSGPPTPMGRLALSMFFADAEPAAARGLAREGLECLTPDAFLRDVMQLTGGSAPTAGVLRRFAVRLRDLPEDDLAALQAVMKPGVASGLRLAAEELRKHRDQPIDIAIQKALEAAWAAGVRDAVEQALRARAN